LFLCLGLDLLFSRPLAAIISVFGAWKALLNPLAPGWQKNNLEHIAQLLCGSFGIEPKDPADDMVGPYLIGGVVASGFRCRFEGSDDDPCRVRAQIQALAIDESELGQ